MEGLTIHEASQTTGWSPRMLRYLERVGLVEPARNGAGYRLFGAAELQRLRTLRELVARFDCGLSDVAFAKRMHDDGRLHAALERWLADRAARPAGVAPSDWLRFEQEKHERLLRRPARDEGRRFARAPAIAASIVETSTTEIA